MSINLISDLRSLLDGWKDALEYNNREVIIRTVRYIELKLTYTKSVQHENELEDIAREIFEYLSIVETCNRTVVMLEEKIEKAIAELTTNANKMGS